VRPITKTRVLGRIALHAEVYEQVLQMLPYSDLK